MIKFRKIISICLLAVMTITSIPISNFITDNSYIAYADGEFDGNNSGGQDGSTAGSSGNGLTWSQLNQGYRFTIVDRSGQAVFKSVDIVRSTNNLGNTMPGSGLMYTGHRGYSNINNIDNSNFADNYIRKPAIDVVDADGKVILDPNENIWALYRPNSYTYSRGDAFYNWFLTGDVDKSPEGGNVIGGTPGIPSSGSSGTKPSSTYVNNAPRNKMYIEEGQKKQTTTPSGGIVIIIIIVPDYSKTPAKTYPMPSISAYYNSIGRNAIGKYASEAVQKSTYDPMSDTYAARYATYLKNIDKRFDAAFDRAEKYVKEQHPILHAAHRDLKYTTAFNYLYNEIKGYDIPNAHKALLMTNAIHLKFGYNLKIPLKISLDNNIEDSIFINLDNSIKENQYNQEDIVLNTDYYYEFDVDTFSSLQGIKITADQLDTSNSLFDIAYANGDDEQLPYKKLLGNTDKNGVYLFQLIPNVKVLMPNDWNIEKEKIIAEVLGTEFKDPRDPDTLDKTVPNKRESIHSLDKDIQNKIKGKFNNKYSQLITDADATKEKVKLSTVNGKISILQTMKDYDLALYVEPITWYRPATWNNETKGPGSQYKSWVYGTAGNFTCFYAMQNDGKVGSGAKGWNYGGGNSRGGAYSSVYNEVGWSSLVTGERWGSIKYPSTISGRKSAVEQLAMTQNMEGIGLHVYTTDNMVQDDREMITTWDEKLIDPGKPPVPNPKKPDSTDPMLVNIVKFYEEGTDVDGDGVSDEFIRQNFVTGNNPLNVHISDENLGTTRNQVWKVVDWFTDSTEKLSDLKFGQEDIYEDMKSGKSVITNSSSSTRTGTIQLDVDGKNTPGKAKELTLYLKLVLDTDKTDRLEQPLVLEESEISKAFSQDRIGESRSHIVDYNGYAATHTYYCGGCRGNSEDGYWCPGHTCTRTPTGKYDYKFKNFAPINTKLQGDMVKNFEAIHTRDTADTVGTSLIGGGTNTVTSFNEEFVLHRGYDKVTLASYSKTNKTDDVKELLENRMALTPQAVREDDYYDTPLKMELMIDPATSVLRTGVSHSGSCGTSAEYQDHSPQLVDPIDTFVTVKVYQGLRKLIGDETKQGKLNIPIANMTGYMGTMVQNDTSISFYPYIRMTYQKTQEYNTKNDVHILGTHLRELLPNDYAEFGWRTNNRDTSINISSQQWSLHKRATSGTDGWQGTNQVLPGGAIYNLNIKDDNRPMITVNTWQTILYGTPRTVVEATGSLGNAFTVSEAQTEHTKYLDSVIKTLEGLSVVQWVNPNVNATNAWSAGGIKVGSGVNLTGLDGSKGSTEDKYYLNDDPTGTNGSAGEADLDVVKESSSSMYYRVFSDTSGNIHLASGNDLDALSKVASGTIIADKKVDWKSINSTLTGIAKEIDDRTLLITNFAKAIERNTGNDKTASWATSDGKWYNEAFDGIFIMYQSNKLRLNFVNSPIRSAALDPNLTPKNTGQSDLYTKAYLSQFRLNEQSATTGVGVNGPNYVGQFKDTAVYANDLANMMQSRKFYIPNANVQDLK